MIYVIYKDLSKDIKVQVYFESPNDLIYYFTNIIDILELCIR